MTIVHYYLGRPARVWIAANTRRSPASPREDPPLRYPLRRTAERMPARRASATGSPP